MYKSLTLLIVAACCTFTACKKTEPPAKPIEEDATDFGIHLRGAYIYAYKSPSTGASEGSFSMSVSHISGKKETVTLSASDTPNGVEISFGKISGVQTAQVEMGSLVNLNCNIDTRKMSAGKYYPKVVGISASGLQRVDSFLIEVGE